MNALDEKIKLKVVKRNGKKVDFDGTKIALAIKKGFDSVKNPETDECKYEEKDIINEHIRCDFDFNLIWLWI